MTQKEKQLLLLDISGRLQSGLKVYYINLSDEMPKVWNLIGIPAPHLADILVEGSHRFAAVNIEENIRPYLRPMSSMTEEEREEWADLFNLELDKLNEIDDENKAEELAPYYFGKSHQVSIDWLNKKMFDYRGLIEKGLALEAPKDMYNTKIE